MIAAFILQVKALIEIVSAIQTIATAREWLKKKFKKPTAPS